MLDSNHDLQDKHKRSLSPITEDSISVVTMQRMTKVMTSRDTMQPYLEAIFCVCVILTNPLASIVEQHVQWEILLLEVLSKFADRPDESKHFVF